MIAAVFQFTNALAEFKLRIKAKGVPKGARGKAVCSVIDLKVYVIRLIYVSHLRSNYMCVIYHTASRWWSAWICEALFLLAFQFNENLFTKISICKVFYYL